MRRAAFLAGRGGGLEASARLPRIALLGNPNTGKSTLFNRLTGLNQRVANYPGITVQKKSGRVLLEGGWAEVVDLPGAYSLAAASPDEKVVQQALEAGGEGAVDLVVCVVDATNLRRNLLIVSQAAELGLPMVIALNQWDAAGRQGLRINLELLEDRLGVPVVPTVARTGEGLAALKRAMAQGLRDGRYFPRVVWPEAVECAVEMLRNAAAAAGRELTKPQALRVLFDTDSAYAEALDLPEHLPLLRRNARELLRSRHLNPGAAEAVLHYKHLDALLEGVVEESGTGRPRDSIDALLLHRFWGVVIFVGVMFLVFQSLYAWASPLMDAIDAGTAWLQGVVGAALEGLPLFQSLVVDGVIGGVGSVVIFLPQILILFFFIGLLEDSGYLARAAFLMDKLLGWCGLNGKSFVPLLSGYACAVPSIMAARALEDPRARLTTILMVPFMSCSARLPVYVLLIGAFVEPRYGSWVAGWVLFVMHFVGAAVAMPLAWVLNRLVLKTPRQPFILEMPPYRVPALRNVLMRMWERGREFLVRAGTVIVAFSVVIWALLYFPRPAEVEQRVRAEVLAEAGEAGLEPAQAEAELEAGESELAEVLARRLDAAYVGQSYLGRFGKLVQPVFAAAGFDWKITVGVLASFPAREVIIATLGIIYNLGGEVDEESHDLRAMLAREVWHEGPRRGQPVFTLPVVFALMVFFALCLQCGATVAVMAKELNWSWAVGSFVMMTALAWLAAVAVYQAGSRLPL